MDLASAPVAWANIITAIGFIVLAVIMFLIPKSVLMQDAPDQAKWRDFRWWGVGLIIVQLGIYALFS